jgi:hypothetical protein
MTPMKQQLHKITDAVTAAGEAVSSAGDICFTIVAGQIAGMGATCLEKMLLTGEALPNNKAEATKENKTEDSQEKSRTSANEPVSLNRKKAQKMAEAMSKHVSAPEEPII